MVGEKGKQLINNLLNPWKFKLGMLRKLPSVVFWGVRMRILTPEKCELSLPFSWRSQNPFRSIYFAAMAGAGELSTGALCLLHLADRGSWSMLVVGFKAEYYKKADSQLFFSCDQGKQLRETLDKIEYTGEPATLEMISTATNAKNEEVARFFVTWSFKKKLPE